jgi:penicillin amidase
MEIVVVAGAILLVLVVLVLGSYQLIFRRALPRTSGEIEVDGPGTEIEIRRDRWGVPHVRAGSREDGAFAIGFVQAQDRLWQMELHRRIAAGRLSEVIGERGLPIDRLMRRLGLRRISEAEWHVTHAAGELRPLLAAYARGVNAAIRDRPPAAEFTILRHRPEPWEPEDSLAVGRLLSFIQAGNWEAQLIRMRMLKELGPEMTAALDPAFPRGNPLVGDAADPGAETIPDGAAGVVGDELLEQLADARELLQLSAWGSGSNSWVLDGSRTGSGRPLLANDPHGALTTPSSWYQLRLHTPDDELAGLSFLGAPFVLFGHNRRVAWGLTNAQISIQDLYVERFNPNNPLQFDDGGEWQDAVRFRETILVRGKTPVVEDVLVTRRGPLISGALSGSQPPISLRWVGFDSEVDSMSWAMRLNRCQDWKGFRFAMGSMSSPALTATYADVDGNIGFRVSGFIPIRKPGGGRLPSQGWDRGAEWRGYIPFEEMPESFNPPSGMIVAANNPIAYGTHPLVTEASTGYRARRIIDRVAAAREMSVDDCVALQADTHSIPGTRLAGLLLDRLGGAGDADLGAALSVLRDWDGEMSPGSAGAVIYERTLERLLENCVGARLSPALRHQILGGSVHPFFPVGPFTGRLHPALLEALEDGRTIPAGEVDPVARDGVLRRALQEATAMISARQGPDPAAWRWGPEQPVVFEHPLAAAVPVLARLFNRGPYEGSGDADTVRLSGRGFGEGVVSPTTSAFLRAVYDVGGWSGSVFSHPPGQSGHPASRNYADLIPGWLEGSPLPLAFGEEAGAAVDGLRALRLRPAGASKAG